MKKRMFPLMLVLCISLLCTSAAADVISSPEATVKDAIYIAGNPDMYPLEYYNEKTDSYEGILPNIYEEISRQTGIDFAYISASSEDRQKELGENCQVEIVSAHRKGAITLAQEVELFSHSKGGQKQTVCIGFTKIAGADVAAAVETAVRSTDKTAWLAAAMDSEKPPESLTAFFIALGAAFVLLLALIASLVHIQKKRRALLEQDKTKLTDPMTGIGNFAYFKDCYFHHISPPMRPLYYVAYIGVDIEKIETYFGVVQSEELQRYAAATISDVIRDSDFAARIENGVFAVCFMSPDTERAKESITALLDKLNAFDKSYAEENGVVFRCGLYSLDKQNTPPETVIYNARQGYLNAAAGKEDVCLCDSAVLDRVAMRGRLQKKISLALKNKEFHVYLQLIYDTNSNSFCGAEVLSRWHSSDEGVLSPGNYIEDMKTAGMIDKLDFYILDQTCSILNGWKGTEMEHLRLSCNFTRKTLSLPSFIEQFESILLKYSFPRSNLLVEITEDSLADDSNLAYKNILAIKNLGCKIALDDFGSGYTSFRDLCDYPLDVIKIDRDMVIKAADERAYSVLCSIISMAHTLDLTVLCEGIETDYENKLVTEAGCDYIQGFLHSRVLPLENAVDFYKSKI